MTIVSLSSWRDFNKILHLLNANYADFIQCSSIFRGSTLEFNLDYWYIISRPLLLVPSLIKYLALPQTTMRL